MDREVRGKERKGNKHSRRIGENAFVWSLRCTQGCYSWDVVCLVKKVGALTWEQWRDFGRFQMPLPCCHTTSGEPLLALRLLCSILDSQVKMWEGRTDWQYQECMCMPKEPGGGCWVWVGEIQYLCSTRIVGGALLLPGSTTEDPQAKKRMLGANAAKLLCTWNLLCMQHVFYMQLHATCVLHATVAL